VILIGKHQEGISLNPLEYLLDNDGKLKKFSSKKSAKKFLRTYFYNFSEDDLEDSFIYEKFK
jgi:hypothetical protein